MHFETERGEHPGDDVGGAMLFERRLRMRVDVTPPSGHLVMERADLIDDRHGRKRTMRKGREAAMILSPPARFSSAVVRLVFG